MATTLDPAELDRLVDVAECARVGDWSLRSALCRYAQPEPVRVGQVLEVVRRTEFALARHAKRLATAGPALWAALESGESGEGEDREILVLLGVARELDRLGDVLAAWAERCDDASPEPSVDAVVADVTARLDAAGIPREDSEGYRGPRRG